MIQHRRWTEARNRDEFDRVVQAAAGMLAIAESVSAQEHR